MNLSQIFGKVYKGFVLLKYGNLCGFYRICTPSRDIKHVNGVNNDTFL